MGRACGHTARPMTARFIVGIDLGTTNTVVAFADTLTAGEGSLPRAQVFPLPQWVAAGEVASRPSLPSARYQATEEELPEARTLHTDGRAVSYRRGVHARAPGQAALWFLDAGMQHVSADRVPMLDLDVRA